MVLLGHGSFGIVLSNPRLPIIDENYDDIVNLNQVSKILYYAIDEKNKKIYEPYSFEDFELECDDIILLAKQYENVFNSNYFMLPIKGGILDKKKFMEKYNDVNTKYNFKWLSGSTSSLKIINSLLESVEDIYQIIYEKGDVISRDINIFYAGIKNIFESINTSNDYGFFFDDIKLINLVTHDNKIKMIDFSCPVNTNTTHDKIIVQIENSKLHCIYYFTYPIITNIILYEQINMLTILNISKATKINYYLLLRFQSIQNKQNLNYKFKLIQKLLSITNRYFQNYKKEIKLLNYNMINKINNIEDIDKYSEYKTITMVDFSVSIINLLLDHNLIHDKPRKDLINNIFIGYDNLIKQLFPNENNSLDKIIFLLKNINLYSFGFIFIEWICRNVNINENINENISTNISTNKDTLEKMFDIIILSCTNYVVIDGNLFLSISNLNIEKINFFL
jgi:hypothetical protein